jgi:hypothetical protein
MEMSVKLHVAEASPSGEGAPCTHWVAGWGGSTSILDTEIVNNFLHIRKWNSGRRARNLPLFWLSDPEPELYLVGFRNSFSFRYLNF